jgi:predicted transposase YdaD
MNMLITEWNWEDAMEVRFNEGWEGGEAKGREEGREEIAKNALAMGMTPEMISGITGLDIEVIKKLAGQ